MTAPKINLDRYRQGAYTTHGKLSIRGIWICDTLELTPFDGVGCLADGSYPVALSYEGYEFVVRVLPSNAIMRVGYSYSSCKGSDILLLSEYGLQRVKDELKGTLQVVTLEITENFM